VIEIEDPQVPLTAVDARVCLEVRHERLASRSGAPPARSARLLDVARAAAPEVLAKTVTTPMLVTAPGAVERCQRQHSLALAALLLPFVHEQMFA